jgi:predicted hotdog family 3-hydroxylacyl-ACP dehydratase
VRQASRDQWESVTTVDPVGDQLAKWRAVIVIGDGLPSRACIEANAQALARYAALCQEANVEAEQKALLHRARCNLAARRGEYRAAMEVTGA